MSALVGPAESDPFLGHPDGTGGSDAAAQPCRHPLSRRHHHDFGRAAAIPPYRWRCLDCQYRQLMDTEDPEPPPPAWLVSSCTECDESWTVDVSAAQVEHELVGLLAQLHAADMHDEAWPQMLLRRQYIDSEGAA